MTRRTKAFDLPVGWNERRAVPANLSLDCRNNAVLVPADFSYRVEQKRDWSAASSSPASELISVTRQTYPAQREPCINDRVVIKNPVWRPQNADPHRHI